MTDSQPGLLRRTFGWIWWAINGTRRIVLNLLFLLIVFALLFAWIKRGAPPLKEQTQLVLDLSGALVEQRAGRNRDSALRELRTGQNEQTPLRDVLQALDSAAKDPKIIGAVLVLDGLSNAGPANLHEVALAMGRFKANGKKIVAWGSGYTQAQYYLAAHANEVYMHPMGTLYLRGYGGLRNYYRDLFDRIGVSANVIRAGKYKNFGESFVANEPSKETLEADALLYDALWASYTGDVETARKLPAGSLAKSIDELPQRMAAAGGDIAKMALDAKLVDGLKTRDELRAMLIQRGAKDDEAKTFRQVNLGGYLGRHKPQIGGDAVGVIVAEGEISEGEAPPGAIGGRSTAELVRQARDDDKIKAIVLRVDSPGGSAFGSELVRRELELTRLAGKPVVVSMGDLAASGGFWISMAADEVIADEATITGSIGVVAMLPSGEQAMGKLGLHTGGYATHWLVGAYDPRRGLDPRFEKLLQSSIDHVYADFTGKVAAARKTTPDKIDAVGQGRVWTGAQARERGLVDRTGSYADALKAAAARAKLADGYRIQYIEPEPGRAERVLNLLCTSIVASLGLPLDGQAA
ncbi:MAG: signal peptide peptidase SppA, partial [Burkholderiales bacterium]|nr:signal peptide peptidase SppA [Burkholderiales bacterium]